MKQLSREQINELKERIKRGEVLESEEDLAQLRQAIEQIHIKVREEHRKTAKPKTAEAARVDAKAESMSKERMMDLLGMELKK